MNNSLLTNPHQRKLLKKWGAILESGKPIESETTKIALAQVLENTRNYYKTSSMLNEAGVSQSQIVGKSPIGADGSSAGYIKGGAGYAGLPMGGNDNFYLPNVVMPMLRRIMPDLMANELVAVQPLNGPVGYALAYRPLLGQHGQFTNGLTAQNEIGYNPVDTRWTGTQLSGEAIAGLDRADEKGAKYWDAYSGNNQWLGAGADLGKAEWATLDDNYPTVTFGLIQKAVEAKTRKLAAHWSPELAEDMQAMHGIDVEREMINTLTYEVGAEIDRQIVSEMVKAAIIGGAVSKWTPLSADGLDQMGRLATLLTQITIEAGQIAIRTKRGAANFAITTPRVCALLSQLGMNKYTSFKPSAAMPSVPDTGVGALAKVGLINDDSMLLIRDSHVQAKASDYMLIGYKGKQAGDSGIIYCPYIPLQLSKVMQPGTFTPSVGARTRYGIMSNPWDAKNFYHFIKIETYNAGGYEWNGSRNFIAEPSDINLNGTGLPGNPVMPEIPA